ncbi:nucleoporin 62 like [Hoplias malabaricus]|uniref:nucleoporin 62 like n=1 Tax=Hoplias malabaricus TaxID=27720 RepID=UPI003462BA8A
MSFSFGQSSGGGFTFGTPKTTATVPAATGFGLQTSTPAGGGFTFGTPTQPLAQAQPLAQVQAQAQPLMQSQAQPLMQAQAQPLMQAQAQPLMQAQAQPLMQAQAQPLMQSQVQPLMQSQALAPATTSQIAGLLAQPATSNGSQGGFSFGAISQNSTGVGSFSFGAATPKLGLNIPAASLPATTGMPLGNLAASSSGGTGFTLGLSAQTTAAAQQSTGGFSFGMPKVQATVPATAQTTPALSLGSAPTGLTLTSAVPASSSTTGISFGIKPAATPALATTAAANQSVPVSSLFAMPLTPATNFTLGAPVTSTAPAVTSAASASASLTLKPLGVAATSVATTAAATTAAAPGFSLGLKPAASAAPVTAAVTATTTITASTAPVMSYAQLEALINKWSSELEDQERHFLQQATQVNAWDRMLVENGEKITALHKDMEKVKLDQRRLDQELDFILSQQKELEELLAPLEESVKEQSGTIYMQNADEERERTYKLAENIDAQLKRMSQDLKEIIEHLNTSNGPADTSDPLQQICKILNAHMDSLQWVEQNSVLLQRRVEEVSKLCESRSKEQEKSFRLNFQ